MAQAAAVLRGLAVETSFGHALGLELDTELVLLHLQPSLDALLAYAARLEAALRDDPFSLNDPLSRGLRGALVARSRFVEDELSHCVAAGVRQYLVMGAGLDTFAYRNPYREHGLRVFEVDHPASQRYKRARMGEHEGLHYVAVDFQHDDLGQRLIETGFDPGRVIAWIWEGVTMYLPKPAVEATLRQLQKLSPPGSRVMVSYMVPNSIPGGRAGSRVARGESPPFRAVGRCS